MLSQELPEHEEELLLEELSHEPLLIQSELEEDDDLDES